MSRFLAVFYSAVLALCAGNAFAQAAYVHDMTGTATAATGSGQRALKIGDLIDSGSTVSTGDKSTAVIKFEDGQIMVLTERSSFRIVDYRYNKQRVSQSSAVFSLVQGGLRFISGVIGATNRSSFRLTAGTATMGIRGTEGVVVYDNVAQAVFAAVFAGAVDVLTAQGTQSVFVGLFTRVGLNQAPTTPQSIALATPAVKVVLDNAMVQKTPINTPAVLRSSATAAAAVANALALLVQANLQPGNAALLAQAQAANAAAQALLVIAIQDAQRAYDEAVNEGGATRSDPPAGELPAAPTGSTTGDGTTPSGSGGSGGGGTSCGASCS